MRFVFWFLLTTIALSTHLKAVEFPIKMPGFKKGFILKESTRQRKLLLITGCGRSGTGFMSDFLRASGVDAQHEEMGKEGSVSWLMGSDIGWAPWGPLYRDYRFKHIFHQVRDPVKVIQSMYNLPPRAKWDWVAESLPQMNSTDSSLTKCVKYWIFWNKMVEAKAEWTYRIEDFDKVYKKMGKKLGLFFDKKVLASIPKDTNTKGPPSRPITWDILREEIEPELFGLLQAEAKRYGYYAGE